MALLPYIMEEAEKSVKTGVPLMRALWLEYPEAKKAGNIYDEYLFGDDLLVAPVVEEGKTEREVYIPRVPGSICSQARNLKAHGL